MVKPFAEASLDSNQATTAVQHAIKSMLCDTERYTPLLAVLDLPQQAAQVHIAAESPPPSRACPALAACHLTSFLHT